MSSDSNGPGFPRFNRSDPSWVSIIVLCLIVVKGALVALGYLPSGV